jgi:hypothetical protein
MFNDAKADLGQLAHGRPEGRHFGFTLGQQAFIEGVDIGVMADGDEGRHLELAPHPSRAGFRQLGFVAHTGTRLMLGGDDPQIGDELGRRRKPLTVL